MKPKILVTNMIPEEPLARLRQECEVAINAEDRFMPHEELKRAIRGQDGLICLLSDNINPEVMDAAGGTLKVIANYAVGYNNIDVPAATERKIPVTNTPGVLTDTTADLTWAIILSTVRRICEGDRLMRRRAFTGWTPLFMLGGDITGATLGIYGFGRIGQAVARRAKGFGMQIIFNEEASVPEAVTRELGARSVDFETLLRESDILCVHVPLTPQTRHRFKIEELKKMKKTAYLINTARGPIVKETDLVAALREGVIAGAGLDVYEEEPKTAPGLAELPNAVLVPHLGSATIVTRLKMGNMAVENAIAAVNGRRPPNCVNPEVLG